jgi:hypothetical protein
MLRECLWKTCCVQSELFEKARKLGAKTEGAFTDQVTHLIPLEPEGAEYKACSRPYTMLVVRLIRIRYTQFHPFTSVTLAMYEGWKAKTGSN